MSYGVWRIKTKGVFVTDAAHPIDWRIAVKPPAEGPLAEWPLSRSLRRAKTSAGDGSRQSLAKAAEAIQQLDSYANVSLIKLAPDQLAVHVKRRNAVMCIEADRVRFVADDAVVYRSVDPSKSGRLSGSHSLRVSSKTAAAHHQVGLYAGGRCERTGSSYERRSTC